MNKKTIIMKDLKDLEKYFKLPIWVITLLIWIGTVAFVILMAIVDNPS
jgi:hypothetical protein